MHATDRDRRRPMEPEGSAYGLRTDDSGSIHSSAQGASIIQVETLGKHGLLLLWINCVITAIAIVGLFVAYDAYRHLRNHVNVLQYDLADLRAKTGNAHENTE
jgi:hypothetical protein